MTVVGSTNSIEIYSPPQSYPAAMARTIREAFHDADALYETITRTSSVAFSTSAHRTIVIYRADFLREL